MKNIYNLKGTGFEMIPEEDEEKIRTEYNTGKKFYNIENSLRESVMSSFRLNSKESCNVREVNQMLDTIKSKNTKEVREFNIKMKTSLTLTSPTHRPSEMPDHLKENIGLPNQSMTPVAPIKKSMTVMKVRHMRQKSKERLIESPSTAEITLDSAKSKRAVNLSEDKIERPDKSPSVNPSVSLSFKESSKFFNKPIIVKADDNKPQISMLNEILSPKTRRIDESEKSNSHNYSSNTTPEKINRDQAVKLRKVVKSGTAPDNKLPSISTGRKRTDINYDIKNIFNAANNYKEDPLIKMKLDDIMQNIADIRCVLNQKSKTRVKVSSAPSNNEDRTNVVNNFAAMNSTTSHLRNNAFVKSGVGLVGNENYKKPVIANNTNKNGVIKVFKDKDKSPIRLVKK